VDQLDYKKCVWEQLFTVIVVTVAGKTFKVGYEDEITVSAIMHLQPIPARLVC